ncbi:MAG TPA: hypothetical protein VFO91_19565 [Anaerolineales bacterium]|nr:hypothetical protein [Anaerolineales bacterium]
MTASEEKQVAFLGTYFDRDAVLRLSRWADILAWVILTVYVLSWLFSMILFLGQYATGLYVDKGATFLTVLNIFAPYFLQPLPGVFYFFGLQAVSKGMLILMDMEDNTRRAARK